MSRPMTRSISKKAAAPPPIPAASVAAIEENEYDLSQADESEYDQEFVEYDGEFDAEFEYEDDSEFEKWADEERQRILLVLQDDAQLESISQAIRRIQGRS